jgi:predicted Zn-dependent protease
LLCLYRLLQLAAVIAHELAHHVCRHHAEAVSKSLLLLPLRFTVILCFGWRSVPLLAAINVWQLCDRRAAELEADAVGVRMLHNTRFFESDALLTALTRLNGEEDSWVPGCLRTHPHIEQRKKRIADLIASFASVDDDDDTDSENACSKDDDSGDDDSGDGEVDGRMNL